MNNQEAFDRVKAHLLSMDGPSVNGEYCAYRGENGKKCAIGALIPDTMYYTEMDYEFMSVTKIIQNFDEIRRLFADVNLGLLKRLQTIHDDTSNWDCGRFIGINELKEAASKYGVYYG